VRFHRTTIGVCVIIKTAEYTLHTRCEAGLVRIANPKKE